MNSKSVSVYKGLRIVPGTYKCSRNISHLLRSMFCLPNELLGGKHHILLLFLSSKSPFSSVPYSKLAFRIYIVLGRKCFLLELYIRWLNLFQFFIDSLNNLRCFNLLFALSVIVVTCLRETKLATVFINTDNILFVKAWIWQ